MLRAENVKWEILDFTLICKTFEPCIKGYTTNSLCIYKMFENNFNTKWLLTSFILMQTPIFHYALLLNEQF